MQEFLIQDKNNAAYYAKKYDLMYSIKYIILKKITKLLTPPWLIKSLTISSLPEVMLNTSRAASSIIYKMI